MAETSVPVAISLFRFTREGRHPEWQPWIPALRFAPVGMTPTGNEIVRREHARESRRVSSSHCLTASLFIFGAPERTEEPR